MDRKSRMVALSAPMVTSTDVSFAVKRTIVSSAGAVAGSGLAGVLAGVVELGSPGGVEAVVAVGCDGVLVDSADGVVDSVVVVAELVSAGSSDVEHADAVRAPRAAAIEMVRLMVIGPCTRRRRGGRLRARSWRRGCRATTPWRRSRRPGRDGRSVGWRPLLPRRARRWRSCR